VRPSIESFDSSVDWSSSHCIKNTFSQTKQTNKTLQKSRNSPIRNPHKHTHTHTTRRSTNDLLEFSEDDAAHERGELRARVTVPMRQRIHVARPVQVCHIKSMNVFVGASSLTLSPIETHELTRKLNISNKSCARKITSAYAYEESVNRISQTTNLHKTSNIDRGKRTNAG
jgi:hypothetical protein